MRRLVCLLVLLIGEAGSARAANAGFVQILVPAGAASMQVGIWYPTEAAQTPHTLELLAGSWADAAPVAGGRHPLVVISHGQGGSLAEHVDTVTGPVTTRSIRGGSARSASRQAVSRCSRWRAGCRITA